MAFASSLSEELLGRFSKSIATADRVGAAFEFQRSARVLPLGIAELDDMLPSGGLQYGDVVELRVHGGSAAATSFAFAACRAAQFHLQSWCAFVDPSATLFAPGAAQLGVNLERLLVVRPDLKSIGRVAVRIAEAKLVSVLVIDLRGALGDISFDAYKWQRTVRKLSLVIKQLSTCVLLLTEARNARVLPLPAALRLELTRSSPTALEVRIGKERTGRIAAPRNIEWSAFTSAFTRGTGVLA
jgi:hypothetical protein